MQWMALAEKWLPKQYETEVMFGEMKIFRIPTLTLNVILQSFGNTVNNCSHSGSEMDAELIMW